MSKRSSPGKPQDRGLVTAVALFSISVLVGVAWVINRGDSLSERLHEIAPVVRPELRSGREYGAPGTPSGLRLSQTDRMTLGYRDRGAFVGPGRALRGDLVQVNDQVFRILQIDEVRGYAHCGPSAFRWRCGTTPQQALDQRIGDHLVACFNKGYNREGQQLGQCYVGTTDLGGWMIEQGMAFAASDRFDYGVSEKIAKREKRGYWFSVP